MILRSWNTNKNETAKSSTNIHAKTPFTFTIMFHHLQMHAKLTYFTLDFAFKHENHQVNYQILHARATGMVINRANVYNITSYENKCFYYGFEFQNKHLR